MVAELVEAVTMLLVGSNDHHGACSASRESMNIGGSDDGIVVVMVTVLKVTVTIKRVIVKS